MSALPPKADMCGAIKDVRFVPKADISFAATRLHRGNNISYFLKKLTTATATITATTTSAQISSFEIVSRPQPIICVSPYSITSSARVSSVGGTVRPSALAVLRLITSSYLVGAWTGRSLGLAPLRM